MAGYQRGYNFPPPSSWDPNSWQNQNGSQIQYGGQAPFPQNNGFAENRPMIHPMEYRGFQPRRADNQPYPTYGNNNNPSSQMVYNNSRPMAPMMSGYPGNNFSHCNASSNKCRPKAPKKITKPANVQKAQQNEKNDAAAVEFFCDPCEKTFKCMKNRDAHLKDHAKCEFEGCNFIASGKVLKLHFTQNHEAGRSRVVLQNNADIEKWKAARRKNYPSPSRLKEKMAVNQKKMETGNVIKTKEFSYKHSGSLTGSNPQPNTFAASTSQRSELNNNKQKISEVPKMITAESPKPFSILHADSKNTLGTLTELERKSAFQNALANLSSNYVDSDDSSDDEPNQLIIANRDRKNTNTSNGKEHDKNHPIKNDGGGLDNAIDLTVSSRDAHTKNGAVEQLDGGDYPRPNNQISKGELLNKEKCQQTTTDKSYEGRKNKGKRSNNYAANTNHPSKIARKSKPTLLEMLLADNIKNERNTILQCVRYIVKKNFFMDEK